jgi:tetratricopeptide (TPR) repeat protein
MTKSTSRTKGKGPRRATVLTIVLIAVLLALAAGGAWWGITRGQRAALAKAGQERANTLELARSYMQRQEYERAMELLDKLLLSDANDAEARALLDEVIRRKQATELETKQQELAALERQQAQLQAGLQELGSSLKEKAPKEKATVVVAPKPVPEDASAK